MGILFLILWLLLIPGAVGGIFANRKEGSTLGLPLWLVWSLLTGYMLLWAVFQLICVPFILLERPFSEVVIGYGAVSILLALAGILCWSRHFSFHKGLIVGNGQLSEYKRAGDVADKERDGKGHYKEKWDKYLPVILWLIFWSVLLFQILQVFNTTYKDGDDAYYVVIASMTEDSDTMYRKLPYTGGTTSLDARHGLAPFPVWIAYLARLSGIRTVAVAHVAVPAVLIPMTYGIYALIGRFLWGRKRGRLPLFLIFTELLVLFGDYSISSPENFLIARTRQGKATLGNLVFPFLIYLLLRLMKKLDKEEKVDYRLWIYMGLGVLTGCLCSTLGALLSGLLLGTAGICGAICFRKWRFLVPMGLCCVPALCYAILYVRLT